MACQARPGRRRSNTHKPKQPMRPNLGWIAGAVLMVAPGPSARAQAPAAAAVKVAWTVAKQRIEGFGGSGAFRQADNLMGFPEPQRTEVLDLLFSTTKGAGLTIVRNCIGDGGTTAEGSTWGSKSDGPIPTIELKPGEWNWTGDEAQVWLMKEAAKRGCTRFISAAWSPPAWMKTNNSVINGGNLRKDKYRAYAEYLAAYVKGYKQHHGIDIYAVSPQNEPTFTGAYSCCQWSAGDFLELTRDHIAPVWNEQKITARYMLGEHMFWDEAFAVPSLNDPVACARVDIVAAHGYGNPNGFGVLPTARAKGKQIWETEVYNNADESNNREGKGTIANALYWAEYIHNHLTVSEANAWLCWWLIAKYPFEGTLVTLAEPVVDDTQAAFRSDIITQKTPGRAVDIDLDITRAKKLYLLVDVADGRFNGDRADWVEPRLIGPNGEKKLTELQWASASSGWNTPKINKSVGNEQDLIVNGVTYAYGIGTHAQSLIEYDLPPGYQRFKCKAGLDELVLTLKEAPENGSVRFMVFTQDPNGGAKNARRVYTAYPRLWALGNFSRFVRPGWCRIEATATPAPGVLVSAYKDQATGNFAIVAINKNDAAQALAITVDGAAAAAATGYRTSAGENLQPLAESRFTNGSLAVTLVPQSVTTFVGKAQ